MTPKIFNVGLNRAGTTSLTAACSILGLRSVHFQHQGRRLVDIIQTNLAARRRPFAGIEDDFDMFSDFAGQYFFKVLDATYPDSKFIVTNRDLESWLASRERKVQKNLANPNYRYAFNKVDRPAWTAEREQFLAAATDYFKRRPGGLLIIDIPGGEGWERLCPFLGVEIPDAPFPRNNSSMDSAAPS